MNFPIFRVWSSMWTVEGEDSALVSAGRVITPSPPNICSYFSILRTAEFYVAYPSPSRLCAKVGASSNPEAPTIFCKI